MALHYAFMKLFGILEIMLDMRVAFWKKNLSESDTLLFI